ncbi:MAG: hypothetical protein V3T72_14440, partial [Thermoanaerobaculia bacterium]
MDFPAKNLVDAFNACDPVLPLKADDERYVDLSAGRGDEGRALVECKKRFLSSNAPWAPGRELMIDMLRKRLDLDLLFEEGAVEELIAASGGHPRLLLTLVRNAVISADDPPVARAVARKVVRRLVNDYGRSIPEE